MTHDTKPDDNWEWETPEQRRPRRLDDDGDDSSFPIVWLVIGGLAGILTVGLIVLGVTRLVSKQQPPPTPTVLPTAVLPATPTTTSLMDVTPTAVPTIEVLPTAPQVINTPTTIPPTPETEPGAEVAPPAQLQVGSFVKVVNTGGSGLSLRAGPGTNNARLLVADATSIMEVVGGPKDDEQGETDDATGAIYRWWYLKYTDGTEGWARGDFLETTAAP